MHYFFITLDMSQKSLSAILIVGIHFILLVYEVDGFTEEKEGSKYLNISLTYSNSEVLKKYAEVWSGIKDQIKAINGQLGEYGKDYMEIKFDSDDDLPLNKTLRVSYTHNYYQNYFQKRW